MDADRATIDFLDNKISPLGRRTLSSSSLVDEEGPGGPSKAGPKTPTSEAKRRRKGLLSIASMPDVAVKVDVQVDDDDCAMAQVDGEDDGDEAVNKHCLGCGRSSATGRCFLRPEELVKWMTPRRRGHWCRDCFNLWRLLLSTRTTLVMLTVHLRNCANITKEWSVGMLAYHSLRRDGVERVSTAVLLTRMELVRWLMRNLGFDFNGVQAVPLSEWAAKASSSTQLAASSLITMCMAGGGRQLGVLAPLSVSSRTGTTVIPRPMDGSWVGLPTQKVLVSEVADDAELLSRFFGDATQVDQKPVLPRSEVSPETSRCGHMSKEAKKISQMLRSQVANAQVILQAFEGEDWKELREASYTAVLNKLSQVKLDAAEEQVTGILDEAATWCSGLAVAKSFVKKLREANRAKGVRKYGVLADTTTKLHDFLEKHAKVGLSFALMHFKCKFQQPGSSTAHLHTRLTALIDLGLWGTLLGMPVDHGNNSTTPDNWMRGLLISEIAAMIEAMSIEEVDDKRSTLADDLAKVLKLLRACPNPDLLGEVTSDIDHLVALVAVGVPGTNIPVGKVVAAKKHVHNNSRLAMLNKALTESGAGLELMAPAEAMEMKSVHDDLADSRFDGGKGCFMDAALLRVEHQDAQALALAAETSVNLAPGMLVVHHIEQIAGEPMLVGTVLLDAMSQVVEALKMWSALRFEEQALEIRKFLQCVGCTLTAIDLASLHQMLCACRQALSLPEDPDEEVCIRDQASAVESGLAGVVSGCSKSVISAFSNITSSVQDSDPLRAMISKIAEKATANNDARAAILAVLRGVADLASLAPPASAADAVESWLARGATSFLAKAIALMNKVTALSSHLALDLRCVCLADALSGSGAVSDNSGAVGNMAVALAGNIAEAIQLQSLTDLPQSVAKMPVVDFCKGMLHECVDLLAEKFIELASLDALKDNSDQTGDATKLPTLVEFVSTFVDTSRLTNAAASMTMFLNDPDSTRMPCEETLSVMRKVVHATNIGYVACPSFFSHAPTNTPVGYVMALAELYRIVHQIASALAWLANACGGPQGTVSRGLMKKEAEVALDLVMGALIEGTEILENYAGELVDRKDWQKNLYWPAETCKVWMKAVESKLPMLQKVMLQGVANHISDVAQVLSASLPKYDHILSDSVFNTKLVKARLLAWPGQDRATSQAVQLFDAICDAVRYQEKFGIAGEDEKTEELITEGNKVFVSARKFLNILTGLKILYRLTGESQAAEAKKLVETKRDIMPATLLEMLEKVRQRVPIDGKTAGAKGQSRPQMDEST